MKIIHEPKDLRTPFIGQRFRCLGCGLLAEVESEDDLDANQVKMHGEDQVIATVDCPRVDCLGYRVLTVPFPKPTYNQFAGVWEDIDMSVPLKSDKPWWRFW